MKTTRDEVVKALEIASDDPGTLTLSKGFFTLRRGYYWRPKKTPEETFEATLQKLQAAGFTVADVEYGDHYAAFRGGESVKKNSHYWMKFRCERAKAAA